MRFFVVHYDYGTGSTHVGVLAESAAQIESELKFVTVVDDRATAGLDAGLVERLRAKAIPIDDASWDDVRRSKR
jgi:hypothetical protein